MHTHIHKSGVKNSCGQKDIIIFMIIKTVVGGIVFSLPGCITHKPIKNIFDIFYFQMEMIESLKLDLS